VEGKMKKINILIVNLVAIIFMVTNLQAAWLDDIPI
jgi:hypothetical protein